MPAYPCPTLQQAPLPCTETPSVRYPSFRHSDRMRLTRKVAGSGRCLGQAVNRRRDSGGARCCCRTSDPATDDRYVTWWTEENVCNRVDNLRVFSQVLKVAMCFGSSPLENPRSQHAPEAARAQRVQKADQIVGPAQGVRAGPSKMAPVADPRVPRDLEGVPCFPGVGVYHLRFLRVYAQTTEPLQMLLAADAQFSLGPEQENTCLS